ncbi:carbohydrate porin [Novosphingobium sp. TH158]|uniref:carbohydrate porin n=1 Tax=Novosphingobium sp. TH158 TaxID=2067455 RepID=UPI00118182C5|nr:carbohydrate porin [Novosphingobium sp. TH158]
MRAPILRSLLSVAAAMPLALAGAAQAEEAGDGGATGAIALEAEYVSEVMGIVRGPQTGVRRADYASLSLGLDLEAAAGWQGARLQVQAIAATGGTPNALAGTLQGISNIEVEDARLRVFQLYLEQQLPGLPASLRLGFSDLNEEFYVTDSSGLLMAPAFGIGTEFSATGPGGPSIFPSSALALRLKVEPSTASYVMLAAYNAEAGVIGDAGGVRPLLREGALLVGEVGWTGQGKLALGAWSYSRRQPDLRDVTPAGEPVARRAFGGYVLAERRVAGDDERGLTLFFRGGLTDGRTTPYTGSWQAGFLASGVIAGRPDSQVSLGVNQAWLSQRYRLNAADAGDSLRSAETGLELTYSDKLAPWLTVQPDIQYVRNVLRGPAGRDALVLSLRLTAAID